MPILNSQNMSTHKIDGTGYGFSATRIEDLGASEYTLVGIAGDRSGSISGFQHEIEACLKEVVKASRHSPRADNLMLRFVSFSTNLTEVHGFKPLSECHEDDYDGTIYPGSTTALYDAAVNVIESVARYGKDLIAQDYEANAIVFVITDGMENDSTATVKMLKEAVQKAIQGECLESIITILVGVNTDAQTGLSTYLDNLRQDAGFTEYIEVKKADAKTLARLASFMSRSISSQSQALGTGGPSQSLQF